MLYCVTAVHNRYAITEKYVKLLLGQTYRDFTLVLVDDGCTDGTADMVRRLMPTAVILQGDGNLYWGGALHMAYRWICDHAGAEDLVFIANDDGWFPEDYIQRGVEYLMKYPECLITGCGYDTGTGSVRDGALRWNFAHADYAQEFVFNEPCSCASTRSLFLRAEVMKKVGGFHPILLPHYGSDSEWTIRAARKGFAVRSFEDLSYRFTEAKAPGDDVLGTSVRKLFSKRSMRNPVYRINLILLATPIRYLPSALWSQLKRYRGAKIRV